jgi:hypothetical protein
MERYDFIFSYWILAWYLLYYFNIIDTYNPTFALIIALLQNILIILLMVYYNTKLYYIILFIIVVILIKCIPLYTIKNKNIAKKDILTTFILFTIYLFWILLNNVDILYEYNKINNLILHNKNTLPLMVLLDKLFTNLK